MLNARGRAPRATMSLPPLVPFLYAALSPFLFISLSVLRLPLSLLHFEHRYLWNLLHRARCIPLRSFASRLVLSRRGPGDQKRFNLRYHRWRAKPRFVSGLRGGRGSMHVRKPVLRALVTEYRVFSRDWRYRFQHSKNTPTVTLSLAARVC